MHVKKNGFLYILEKYMISNAFWEKRYDFLCILEKDMASGAFWKKDMISCAFGEKI